MGGWEGESIQSIYFWPLHSRFTELIQRSVVSWNFDQRPFGNPHHCVSRPHLPDKATSWHSYLSKNSREFQKGKQINRKTGVITLVDCLTRWSLWYWYLDFYLNHPSDRETKYIDVLCYQTVLQSRLREKYKSFLWRGHLERKATLIFYHLTCSQDDHHLP